MTKELKDFFNSLEKLPELQDQKFTKKVQKLRSYTERIYREISFVTESQHHQIPKLVDELLNVVSEPTMVSKLKQIKRRCQKLYHQQQREDNGLDYDPSSCWSSCDD